MWLYVPRTSTTSTTSSTPSTSALATEVSSEPSDPWHGAEPWVTSNAIAMQQPFSWRGWRNRAWMTLLSGLTSGPSTASRGAAEWISSLPASRANRSLRRARGLAWTTTVGSGRRSAALSLTWDPDGSCWRTSLDSSPKGSPTSLPTLPLSGSMRNGTLSQQPRLAPRTAATECGLWPTPTATDSKMSGGTNGQHQTLTDATVRMWPTPKTTDSKSPSEGDLRRRDPGLRGVAMMARGRNGSPTADLNPFFVASLMGLPVDWLTLSSSEVTALCLQQLRTPSDACSTEQVGPSTEGSST